MSWQLKLLNTVLPLLLRWPLRMISRPTARMRQIERMAPVILRRPAGVHWAPAGSAPVRALWCRGAGAQEASAAILYLHGGAYIMGSRHTHRYLAGRLAALTGLPALLPEYRLAPEAPFPAAFDDAVACYRWLLEEGCHHIVLAGDSAGGGLALALLHHICATGMPMPAALVAFSPWTDLTCSAASLVRNRASEVALPVEKIPRAAAWYAGGADPRNPRVSPLFGTFRGAPPVLIQLSDAEALEDDGRRMAEVLRRDGVAVEVQEWHDTPHVWHAFAGTLPEGREALEKARDFVAARIRPGS